MGTQITSTTPKNFVIPLDQQLLDALVQVSFDVIQRLTRFAGQEGLSLTQLRMLAILRDRSVRMAQLATALGVDRSSVSGLIARAEQRGLVTRTSTRDDGRGIRVQLTDAGQLYTQRLTNGIASALGNLTTGLDKTARVALTDALLAMGSESATD